MESVLSTGEELLRVALFGVCNRESRRSCGFFGAGKPFKQTAPRGLFPRPLRGAAEAGHAPSSPVVTPQRL